jgi:hypothetical protein
MLSERYPSSFAINRPLRYRIEAQVEILIKTHVRCPALWTRKHMIRITQQERHKLRGVTFRNTAENTVHTSRYSDLS